MTADPTARRRAQHGEHPMIQRILIAVLIALGIGAGATNAAAAPGPLGYGNSKAYSSQPTKLYKGKSSYRRSGARIRIGGHIGVGKHNHIGKQSGSKIGIGIGIGIGNGPHYKPAKVWIPGRYVTECQRVWVPGHSEQVWCPPVYNTHYDVCGNPYQVLVKAGYYQTIHHPGFWDTQNLQVWKAGHWSY